MSASWLNKAAQLAKEAKDFRFRLGAIVFNRHGIISQAVNIRKTHPIQKKYGTNEHRIFLHAEVHAIIRAKGNTEGCSIAVARLLRNDKMGLSFPCAGCLAAIQEAGIHTIHFHNGEKYEEFNCSSIPCF